ncbi:MAG: hypothetical protein HUJ61_00925 [Bacilli bacterium]|nr:hypothetical protein [Bacilli bacterium]
MKKFVLLFLIPFLAPSCAMFSESKNTSTFDDFTVEKTEHQYSEIEDKKISWNSMFFLAKPQYFIYFYSITCAHCQSIKNDMIEYGLEHDDFFFCEADETHKIRENIEVSIGATSLDKFCILGYPSLAKFENKIVTINVAGVSSIYSLLNI